MAVSHQYAGEARANNADVGGAELDGGVEEEMILAAGSKLGPYEIVAPLGAGGIGEAADERVKLPAFPTCDRYLYRRQNN